MGLGLAVTALIYRGGLSRSSRRGGSGTFPPRTECEPPPECSVTYTVSARIVNMDGPLPHRAAASVPATKPEQIRDAAMKCFAEHGIAKTSLRTIAEAAGVSLGLIQHYFFTKQQLIESIDRHVLTVFNEALGTSPHAPTAPGTGSQT